MFSVVSFTHVLTADSTTAAVRFFSPFDRVQESDYQKVADLLVKTCVHFFLDQFSF